MTDATLPKLPQATAWITVIETSQGPSSQVNWTQMRGVKHHPLFSADQMTAFAERVRQDERERISDTLSSALQSDLENGVKWLNELASSAFSAEYPALHKALAAMAQQVPERAE